MGDLVLVTFAERLRSVLRASDTAARLGGDEFSIVCENTEPADAEVLAERLRASVTEPLPLSGTTVTIGLSIGIGSVAGGAGARRRLRAGRPRGRRRDVRRQGPAPPAR